MFNDHRFYNVSESFLDADSFVQALVEDSIEFGGFKFDFTVYAVVTSINPLRVYVLHGKEKIVIINCP